MVCCHCAVALPVGCWSQSIEENIVLPQCDRCLQQAKPFICCASRRDLRTNNFSYTLPLNPHMLTPKRNLYDSLKEKDHSRTSLSSDMAEIDIRSDFDNNTLNCTQNLHSAQSISQQDMQLTRSDEEVFSTPPKRVVKDEFVDE
jgi:hypothetical protein